MTEARKTSGPALARRLGALADELDDVPAELWDTCPVLREESRRLEGALVKLRLDIPDPGQLGRSRIPPWGPTRSQTPAPFQGGSAIANEP